MTLAKNALEMFARASKIEIKIGMFTALPYIVAVPYIVAAVLTGPS